MRLVLLAANSFTNSVKASCNVRCLFVVALISINCNNDSTDRCTGPNAKIPANGYICAPLGETCAGIGTLPCCTDECEDNGHNVFNPEDDPNKYLTCDPATSKCVAQPSPDAPDTPQDASNFDPCGFVGEWKLTSPDGTFTCDGGNYYGAEDTLVFTPTVVINGGATGSDFVSEIDSETCTFRTKRTYGGYCIDDEWDLVINISGTSATCMMQIGKVKDYASGECCIEDSTCTFVKL